MHLGIYGDGFQHQDDANPDDPRNPSVDGGDTQMNETASGSVKKHKTRDPVPPDD